MARTVVLVAADAIAVGVAAASAGLPAALATCYCVAVLAALAMGGLYAGRVGARAGEDAGRLALAGVIPAAVALAWMSPGATVGLALTGAAALVAFRAIALAGLRVAGRRGLLTTPALVVGRGALGSEVARLLHAHPEYGLRVRGAVDGDARPGRQRPPGSSAPDHLPCLGPARMAGEVVQRLRIGQVLVCQPAVAGPELTAVVRECRAAGARVSVGPDLPGVGLAVPRRCLDEIRGMPFVPVRGDAGALARRMGKRLLDVTLGTVLVLLAAPTVALLSAAVRLDLRLPPLFRQQRVVGLGRRATIAKLRTLRPAGDPDTTWVIGRRQASRLGRILRSSHADELPQLVSVVRGDLSLVGPRPERPYFARQLAREIPGYADRERVRGGLSGWAQVHGLTGDTSIAERVRFDNYYIEYGSVWLDLLILARTPLAAVSGALRLARGGSS